VVGQLDFETLDGLMQLIAEVFLDKSDKRFDPFGFESGGACRFENLVDVAGF